MKNLFNSKDAKGVRIGSEYLFTLTQARMSEVSITNISKEITARYVAEELIKNQAFFSVEKETIKDNDTFFLVRCRAIVLTEDEYIDIIKEAYRAGQMSMGGF